MPIKPPPVDKFSIDTNKNNTLFEENEYGLSLSVKKSDDIVKINDYFEDPGRLCCTGSGSSQVEKEEDIIL